MQLLIVSDAWFPQVNGVVRTLHSLSTELDALGHRVEWVVPSGFRTVPCPSYAEIRLAVCSPRAVAERIDRACPDAIHIATEGPLGLLARRYCRQRGYPFTTSLHTRFPEYVRARWRVPTGWTYAYLRRFHAAAAAVMVSTESLERELVLRRFRNLQRWSRGVDTTLFRPGISSVYEAPRPISLFVGRVAVEKGIEDFLSLNLPGTKVVVGDGPQRQVLQRRYPDVHFVGVKHGEDLARYYAGADVFVFPSRTDTFGLVMLEALASGVPVAAYPVPGPLDVLNGADVGVLHSDLAHAVQEALKIDRAACRAYAETFSWRNSAQQFVANLHVLR
jgi:glycosyltransferase involved in cell wall biosynthesis